MAVEADFLVVNQSIFEMDRLTNVQTHTKRGTILQIKSPGKHVTTLVW
jgi:hypothetical protein